MRKITQNFNKWMNDPVLLRRFHGWSALVWFAAAIPICIWFSESVPFLVFISVYAVVSSEFSSWQASRVEERQQQEEEKAEKARAEDIEEIVKRVDEKTPDPLD